MHKYVVKEVKSYYATIREIGNINTILLTINLGQLGGHFNLTFYEHLNAKGEKIFQYELRKDKLQNDRNFFFK